MRATIKVWKKGGNHEASHLGYLPYATVLLGAVDCQNLLSKRRERWGEEGSHGVAGRRGGRGPG